MAKFKTGTDNSETLSAEDNNDWYIWGFGGNDKLYGAYGDDFLSGGEGADLLAGGGEGDHGDTADYSQSKAGVIVDLQSDIGKGYGGEAEGDTLIDIENIEGSSYADWLMGSDYANILSGNGGNDLLKGFGGADTLLGGDGVDTASYDGSPSGVVVSLMSGLATGGDATGDELYSIENLTGSAYIDTLEGDNGSNTLRGLGGNDTLRGFGGPDYLYGGSGDDWLFGGDANDKLYGDAGNDVLSGGAGNDILTGGGVGTQDKFLFNTALDATTNVDTLMDFNSADDTFWLSSTIFSSLTPGGVIDADQFQIGSAALDAEDRIVYDQTYGIVMYDPDGTGAAPAVQFAQVMLGQSLAYNDFVVPW